MHRIAIFALTLLTCCLAVRAQGTTLTLDGIADRDFFGASAAGLGDLNGDMVPDYAVGAPGLSVVQPVTGYVRVFSGITNTLLFQLDGADPGDSFGVSVHDAGDVDNDGTPDFIVGATQDGFGLRRGYAQVFSGKTGLELHKVVGADGDNLGRCVVGVGDLDKDGHADFAASAPGATTVNSLSQSVASGKVIVYSGKDMSILATLKSENAGDRYGEALASLPDTDGDGVPEILVSLPGSDANGSDSGQVRVISGATFAVLFSVDGDAAQDGLGASVSSVGDLNGDVKADFVAGAPIGNYARVYSGSDGAVIRTHAGATSTDGMGQSVAGPGDIDGDCIPDVLVGGHFPSAFSTFVGPGLAKVFSGKDGTEILSFTGAANGDDFGASVTGIGDQDKNGVPEFLVGASRAMNSGGDASGGVKVYTNGLAGPALDGGAVTSISMAAGGTQFLSLNAGIARAGHAYLVMGTLSGTAPGIEVWGLRIPLNFDIYMDTLLNTVNQVPLLGALGILDAQGQATASFLIPAGFPQEFAGLTLHHAFVTADAIAQVPKFVSNPVRVDLVQ